MNILHLSDLHFVADDKLNDPLKKRFDFIKREYPDDILVITGDLIDNEGHVAPGTPVPIQTDLNGIMAVLASSPPPIGSIEPHLAVARQELSNAYKTISSFSTEKVYLCAGNHDLAIAGNIYDEALANAFDDLLWKPLNSGHPYLPFGPAIGLPTPTGKSKYPILYPLTSASGVTVRLVGLNTCPLDPGSIVSYATLATGVVGGSQLTALQQMFYPETMLPGVPQLLGLSGVTIVFFHHHPWKHPDLQSGALDALKTAALEMVDASALMNALNGHADLVLFGHRHVEKRYLPNTGPTIGLKYGGIAAGSSRDATKAWRITIGSGGAVTLAQVPIV